MLELHGSVSGSEEPQTLRETIWDTFVASKDVYDVADDFTIVSIRYSNNENMRNLQSFRLVYREFPCDALQPVCEQAFP
jgi:hypothetical protein